MGDGITDSTDLVITVAGSQAGGKKGRLVMESVEISASRDNDPKAGIGNDEPIAMKYGPKEYTLSTENHVNQESAAMLKELYDNDEQPTSATLRSAGTIEARVGKLDWNDLTLSGSDGGDITISLDADLRDVEFDGPDELNDE